MNFVFCSFVIVFVLVSISNNALKKQFPAAILINKIKTMTILKKNEILNITYLLSFLEHFQQKMSEI